MKTGLPNTGINIICVKWGTKYGPAYVNRLYHMVKKNLNHAFDFYCYTDDATGLIPEVNVIDIPEDNDLEVWWNKLALFQAGMFLGLCLYFDVDVVIQNDITDLFKYHDSSCLTLVKSYWKEHKNIIRGYDANNPSNSFNTLYNSSVMLWSGNSLFLIWNHFKSNQEFFMMKYKGIDRFLDHENIPVKHFPHGLIYSRAFGTETEYGPRYDSKGCVSLFYRPEYKVCIFNSFGDRINPRQGIFITKDSYSGYEKYWAQ